MHIDGSRAGRDWENLWEDVEGVHDLGILYITYRTSKKATYHSLCWRSLFSVPSGIPDDIATEVTNNVQFIRRIALNLVGRAIFCCRKYEKVLRVLRSKKRST
jgi:hypothetical protein